MVILDASSAMGGPDPGSASQSLGAFLGCLSSLDDNAKRIHVRPFQSTIESARPRSEGRDGAILRRLFLDHDPVAGFIGPDSFDFALGHEVGDLSVRRYLALADPFRKFF